MKIVARSAFDHDRPFEREFEGIKRFEPISRSDPSQVAILHAGRGEGFFYYVMELADGVKNAKPELSKTEESPTPKDQEHVENSEGPSSKFGPGASDSFYIPHTLREDMRRHGRLPVDQPRPNFESHRTRLLWRCDLQGCSFLEALA